MTRLSQGVVAEAVAHYDFDGASRVLDVGGGRGHFVAAVLDAYPELEGAVFDVPEVAEAAPASTCAPAGWPTAASRSAAASSARCPRATTSTS